MRKIYQFIFLIIALAMAIGGNISVAKSAVTAEMLMPDPLDNDYEKLVKEVLTLLYEKRYTELEFMLDEKLAKVQSDPKAEYEIYVIYQNVFSTDYINMGKLIDNWLKVRPDSYQALLVKANYLIDIGWDIRGGASSNETKDENLEKFREKLAEAQPFVEKSIKQKQDNPIGYVALVETCVIELSSCLPKVVKRIEDNVPGSYYAQRAVLNYLVLRWSGSDKILDKYLAYLKINQMDKYPYLKPLLGYAHYDEAWYLRRKDEYDKAALEMEKALSYGNDYIYLNRYIDTFVNLEQLDKAKVYFDRRLENYPLSFRDKEWYLGALNRKAKSLESDGNITEAIKLFEEVLSYSPKDSTALKYMGYFSWKRKQYDKAEDYFMLANKYHPGSRYNVEMLDKILFKDKRLTEIAALWAAYLVNDPEDPIAHLEVAGTYKHLGDMEQANAHLKKACELGNDKACSIYNRNQ